jgi:hypothetical protein
MACQLWQFHLSLPQLYSDRGLHMVSKMARNVHDPERELNVDCAPGNHRRFILTEGGPTQRLEQRLGLTRAGAPRTLRRVFLSVLATWVPLLVLSTLQGSSIGHLIPVSFLGDFAVHARFLLAVPVLIFADTILGPRLAGAASYFIDSGLVARDDFASFDRAIDVGLRWRDSTVAELILIFLAYVLTITNLLSMAVHVSTWYAIKTNSGISLTWSGWWFVLFCVPLLQFLTLRWIWRLFLWGQFLWRMNRLNLQLIPTHPDHAAGLEFVGGSQRFFGVVLFAWSSGAAGVLANSIVYDHFTLRHFAPLIASSVFVSVGIVLLPLLVFSETLLKTKKFGLHKYGTLAIEYTAAFQKKWIIDPRRPEEPLLGTGDLQSLADLGNSYGYIEKMNAIPMGPRTPVHLALACLIPMAPLLLTTMPLEEILKMAAKFLL